MKGQGQVVFRLSNFDWINNRDMRFFDVLSFAFGGLLFGLASLVVTIQLLENNNIPDHIVKILTIILIILCVVGLLYVAFAHFIIHKKLRVKLKSFPEVIDDFFNGLDDSSIEEIRNKKLRGAETRIKQFAVWYSSVQARLALGRAVIAIVGGIALFYSANILIDQLAEMRTQTESLNNQLGALIAQNTKFEEQLNHEKEVSKTQRTTELVKLLFEEGNDKALKSMAITELSKLNSKHLVLTNANLKGIIAPNLFLADKDMQGIILDGSSIPGITLSGSRLVKAHLLGTDLSYSIMHQTIFNQSELKGASFESAFAAKSKFNGADFSGATFGHSTFTGSNFNSINFTKDPVPLCEVKGIVALKTQIDITSGVENGKSEQVITSLRNINSFHDRFNFSQILGVDFSGAILSGTRFVRAYGEYPNFSSAKIDGVTFKEASILGVNFDDSKQVDVIFSDSNLTGSTWRNAELSRINFSRAVLHCADFSGARVLNKDEDNIAFSLAGADLRRSKGMTKKLLESACGDKDTQLPSSLSHIKLKQCGKKWESLKLKNYDYLDLYLAGDQHNDPKLRKIAFELMKEYNDRYLIQ
ncbi:MAG: pentapeptide repeat-containing protein [Proteobacteria bacterium]|nr:pentapeptide repeat-containing protein [Pseudomonadota bacterium]